MTTVSMFEGEIVRPQHTHELPINWTLVPPYVAGTSFADEQRALRKVLKTQGIAHEPTEREVIDFAYIRYRRWFNDHRIR